MTELVKTIQISTNEIQKTFNQTLEKFLENIEGYKELNNDAKAIAKIFTCMSILIGIEKIKNESKQNK